MKPLTSSIVGCAISVLAMLGQIDGAVAQPSDYFSGKTVRVIVGLEAGGTVDVFVRAFAAHLKKHIPGNPTIIVQNMPGASTYAAINYLAERAAPDGLTIVFSNYNPLGQAFGEAALRTRFDHFEFIAGIGDARVNYIRADAVSGGVRKPADIMKAESLIVGANSIGSTDFSGVLAQLSLQVLGIKHKVIGGYRGGSDIFLAMQRGEVQFHNTSIGTFRTRSAAFIKSGQGIGVAYLVPVDVNGEFEKNKFITEMPAYPDLYREIHGKLPSGPVWDAFNWFTKQTVELTNVGLAPRGTPAAAVDALRVGFERAASDPDFIKESVSRNGIPYSYVSVAQGQEIIRSLAEVSPDLLATLRTAIGAK
jgi:tripartite-type tricarboxylate transporter receptor subunit TctC